MKKENIWIPLLIITISFVLFFISIFILKLSSSTVISFFSALVAISTVIVIWDQNNYSRKPDLVIDEKERPNFFIYNKRDNNTYTNRAITRFDLINIGLGYAKNVNVSIYANIKNFLSKIEEKGEEYAVDYYKLEFDLNYYHYKKKRKQQKKEMGLMPISFSGCQDYALLFNQNYGSFNSGYKIPILKRIIDTKLDLLLSSCLNEHIIIGNHENSILRNMILIISYENYRGKNYSDCYIIDLWSIGSGHMAYGNENELFIPFNLIPTKGKLIRKKGKLSWKSRNKAPA